MQHTSKKNAPANQVHLSPPSRLLSETAKTQSTAARKPSTNLNVKIAEAISPGLAKALATCRTATASSPNARHNCKVIARVITVRDTPMLSGPRQRVA